MAHHHQHCHAFPVVEQPASSQPPAASGSAPQPQQQPGFHHIPSPFAGPGLLHHHHQGFVPYTFQLSAAAAAAAAAAASAPVSPAVVEELIKLSPPGSPPPPPESGRYGMVAMLEHKTEQLQSLVHSLSQGCHHSGGSIQPQAAMAVARIASSISQLALALGVVPPPPQGPAFFLSEPPAPPAAQHHISIGMGSALGLFHQLNGGCIPPPPLAVRSAVVPNNEQEAATPASPPSPPATAAAPAAAPAPEEDQEAVRGDSQEAQQGAAAAGVDEGGGDGSREEEEEGDAEELTPGSYDLVEMNAMEILAEHTHFCDKCGKGFKRDANLRMHMRGHGEQYKSPAALARPTTQGEGSGGSASNGAAETRPRRYSCPYVGCKRNKKHRKFQPLKTVLCVKNHYRRSHCPKSLTCAKCKSKKFSVVADLKTHEKHCGRDKWQCSCGTTFSRKDKLLGHITLFQGHTPAVPLDQHPPAASSSSSSATAAAAAAAAAADLTAFAQHQQQ